MLSAAEVGDVVVVSARINFTSARSMELQVFAHAEGKSAPKRVCAAGLFNFVSLDAAGKPQPLPVWALAEDASAAEKASQAAGKARYLAAKQKRQNDTATAAAAAVHKRDVPSAAAAAVAAAVVGPGGVSAVVAE